MAKQKRKSKKDKGVSRRDFIRTTATAGTVTIAGMAGIKAAEDGPPSSGSPTTLHSGSDAEEQTTSREQAFPRVNRQAILFAIGDTLIPSAPGDPGYRDLEWKGITDEINRRLEEFPDADLELFDRSSSEQLGGAFVHLQENQRAEYFNRILQTGGFKDETLQTKLKEIYAHVREIVFTVYYQNYPEDRWPNDAHRVPLLANGDDHQITNPNTQEIFTGWDRAGYPGPLTWSEEERRRNYFKKIRWQE
ncbi:MAG TPA: hypothetical protein VKN18_25735 [Blastocatellia bacterium]|nr:hypothetical protein [Blastocatellia bacterium]